MSAFERTNCRIFAASQAVGRGGTDYDERAVEACSVLPCIWIVTRRWSHVTCGKPRMNSHVSYMILKSRHYMYMYVTI